jgi:hypothetical protein
MEAGKFSFKFSRQTQKNLVGSSKYAYFSNMRNMKDEILKNLSCSALRIILNFFCFLGASSSGTLGALMHPQHLEQLPLKQLQVIIKKKKK